MAEDSSGRHNDRVFFHLQVSCMKGVASTVQSSAMARTTVVLRLDWRLVAAAFAAAASYRVSFAQWLEEALRLKLACEQAPSPALVAEVAAFCDGADANPEQLPEGQRQVYAKLAAAWDRYWLVPRMSVGMLEEGFTRREDALPYLNRARIAQDWPALTAESPSAASTAGH